jgi:hypothetical protein
VPTTVHIPAALLALVQRRARALGISRNRLIVRALEREVREASDWTPGFLDALKDARPGIQKDVDDMLDQIRRRRRSKPPPEL